MLSWLNARKQITVEISTLILVISSAVLASLSSFANSDIYLTMNKQICSKYYLILEATLHLHTIVNTFFPLFFFLRIDEFQTRPDQPCHKWRSGDRLIVERILSKLCFQIQPRTGRSKRLVPRKREEKKTKSWIWIVKMEQTVDIAGFCVVQICPC